MKGIIFDFNGTMFFDSKKHFEAWNNFCLKYLHKPLTNDLMLRFHGKNNNTIIQSVYPNINDLTIIEKLSKEKEAMYRQSCLNDMEHTQLVDGLEFFLAKAKEKQVPMTIASASIKDNIDFYVSTFKLDRYFNPDLIIYDDGFHPDKISMFLDAAKAINCPIEDCIIFEDSLSGLKFAHEAGASTIICVGEHHDSAYQELDFIDAYIKDFTNLDINSLLK